MREKKITAGSFVFPIILFDAAVIYIVKINKFGLGLVESIPGVLAVLSSVAAIIFIKRYKLNIIQYWLVYLISIVVGAIITGVLAGFLIFFMPIISLITLIIECCVFEFCFFDIKVDSFVEKFVLLILNPVFYVQGVIFVFVIDLVSSA